MSWGENDAVPPRINFVTSSVEQYGGIDPVALEEAIGSLEIHEEKLHDHQSWKEEQVIFSRAIGKTNWKEE